MANAGSKSVSDSILGESEESRPDALAEADIAAGQGIPHEHVREWLALRAKGKKVPPPTP